MEAVNLFDIATPKQWKTISSEDFVQNGKYPVYGANGIIGKAEIYNHEKETVLITCRGATCGTINLSEPYSYINGNAMALDNLDNSKVAIKYLYYYLKNYDFQNVISGSAQPQITRENLRKVQISLPDLETQNKIVAILDKVQSIIDKREETIQKYDELLRATFLDMFGDILSNKKKYPLGIIRELVDEVKYGTSRPAEENGIYPYLRMSNITYSGYMDYMDLKYINLAETDKPKYIVKKGDLLFNRTNSKELVGKTGVYDRDEEMVIAGYLIRVRTNERANTYYLWGYLNSYHGKQTLQGMCRNIVGMANINAQEFQNISILIPPIELQNEYKNIYLKIKQSINILRISLNILQDLFNALSQLAFKGELEFGSGVDLEILLDNDYAFFKDNGNQKSIKQLLERIDKNELNENKFHDSEIYDKAKSFIFELLKVDKIEQVFDNEDDIVKLKLK